MNKRNAVVLISVITAVSLGGAGAYYMGQTGNGGSEGAGAGIMFEFDGELVGCGMTPNVILEATKDMRISWTSDQSLSVELRWNQTNRPGEVFWGGSGSDVVKVIQINHADEGREFYVHWQHTCVGDTPQEIPEGLHFTLTLETLTEGSP